MTIPLWSWDALLSASAGEADGIPNKPITGFSIDTRALEVGEIFVALKDVRDGHDFVTAAFSAGAAAALVRRSYIRRDGDGPLIRVDDPLTALGRIGVAARARLSENARVIAITGSAGKTGTKEMLRACLNPIGRTHAPVKSFNNHWGVPLTLARMPADTQYAVIEIGMNHAGEITPLTKISRPHIAVVTNVLPVHIGNFEDGEIGVANAKAEIFSGLVPDGVAVLPCDSPHFNRLLDAARARHATIITFGAAPEATVRVGDIGVKEQETHITITYGSRRGRIVLGAPGRHLGMNAAAVAAVMVQLGFDAEEALRPLAKIAAPVGRGARSQIAVKNGGTFLLIDESYNANPASVAAALMNLGLVTRTSRPRRIAVLGDMRELGADADHLHRQLLDPILAADVDLVFTCGHHMKHLHELLPRDKRGAWTATSSELAAIIRDALQSGDAVMVKGSLGTNMAPIITAIRSLDVTDGSAKA